MKTTGTKRECRLTDLGHYDSLHPVYNCPYVNFVYGIPILMMEDELTEWRGFIADNEVHFFSII
jgi:hypothetical protein